MANTIMKLHNHLANVSPVQ